MAALQEVVTWLSFFFSLSISLSLSLSFPLPRSLLCTHANKEQGLVGVVINCTISLTKMDSGYRASTRIVKQTTIPCKNHIPLRHPATKTLNPKTLKPKGPGGFAKGPRATRVAEVTASRPGFGVIVIWGGLTLMAS